ncbi:MAG TPA: alpha/beta hydrolase-fold protein, partial [Jatrophihabitans sp.]|nr:alpha/beta hydrolase-fold protein [Jatrophihabitans sp.]
VLELPGYEAPWWLDAAAGESTEAPLAVAAAELDATIDLTVWAPVGLEADRPAPLLVVHDGPEYVRLGAFTQYLGAAVAAGELPPLRAALLAPGDRNAWYSANAAYSRALCEALLPALDEVAPATVRVGVGASLGGLAMLHAHRTYPDRFDGLLLQSGSFFTPALDAQESGFSGFAGVTEFVAATHAARCHERPIPSVLTCGSVEENLANNQLMAATLRRLGYPARLVTVPDAHNYVAWRDALDPHLTALVADVVCARAS